MKTVLRKTKTFVSRCCRAYKKTFGKTIVHVTFSKERNMLTNKKIAIIGGGSGIGLGIARQCLSEGAEVLICARNRSKLETSVEEIGSDKLHCLDWDISDVKSTSSKLQDALAIMKDIDVFFNCAGVSDYAGGHAYTEEMYDYIVDINTKGLFFLCLAEGEYLQKRNKGGKIINITSACGDIPGFDPYTISKWGANCLTKGLARRLISDRIIVNGIAPGEVPTNITAHLQSHINDNNQFTPLHGSGRFTMVKEVAKLVVFLASDDSNNIVGEIIKIDGLSIPPD